MKEMGRRSDFIYHSFIHSFSEYLLGPALCRPMGIAPCEQMMVKAYTRGHVA